MKLIIDISEDVYTRLFDNGIQDNEISLDDICEIARALRLGTTIPDNATNGDVLEQIRAKIDSYCSDNRDRNDGLYIAMKIIDKYMQKVRDE